MKSYKKVENWFFGIAIIIMISAVISYFVFDKHYHDFNIYGYYFVVEYIKLYIQFSIFLGILGWLHYSIKENKKTKTYRIIAVFHLFITVISLIGIMSPYTFSTIDIHDIIRSGSGSFPLPSYEIFSKTIHFFVNLLILIQIIFIGNLIHIKYTNKK